MFCKLESPVFAQCFDSDVGHEMGSWAGSRRLSWRSYEAGTKNDESKLDKEPVAPTQTSSTLSPAPEGKIVARRVGAHHTHIVLSRTRTPLEIYIWI